MILVQRRAPSTRSTTSGGRPAGILSSVTIEGVVRHCQLGLKKHPAARCWSSSSMIWRALWDFGRARSRASMAVMKPCLGK